MTGEKTPCYDLEERLLDYSVRIIKVVEALPNSRTGNHIAGQLPVDMATGKILTGCVKEQTAQCLSHIKTIVESIGHVMDDIVKVNIQLANIADLADVDAIYTKYFPAYLPARTVIGVSELPAGALLQMDAVMSNAESTPPQV